MKNVWMKAAFAALLGVVVLAGCGGAEEEVSTSSSNAVHKDGDGHDHKEGDGHEHKEGEKK